MKLIYVFLVKNTFILFYFLFLIIPASIVNIVVSKQLKIKKGQNDLPWMLQFLVFSYYLMYRFYMTQLLLRRGEVGEILKILKPDHIKVLRGPSSTGPQDEDQLVTERETGWSSREGLTGPWEKDLQVPERRIGWFLRERLAGPWKKVFTSWISQPFSRGPAGLWEKDRLVPEEGVIQKNFCSLKMYIFKQFLGSPEYPHVRTRLLWV